ncbi:enoyl-CoA hydratase-related protein [Sphaerisporangium sp. NBC_01403]|uniref:enoyl-CoA hydratase-related protein n=1 Tax=Sphaerisporangium sp. NBC_01403 TaxID=2903599 RepID=UPI003248144E
MPSPDRTRTRREETLAQLRELFLAEGFASFNIGDLAERLRCSRTTLYAVAPSKEQIVVAAVGSFFKAAAERIEARVAASGDPARQLAVYLEAVAAELQPTSAAFLADVAAFGPANEVYQENTRYAAKRVQSLVTEGVRAGVLRPIHASFVGAAVAEVMNSIQRGAIQSATGFDAAQAYRHLADLVLAGLSTAPVDEQAVTGTSVLYEVADGVATIELDRPESSNALDLPMARALGDAAEAAAADPGVRCVLLLGRGRDFCAGGDVTAMYGAADRAGYVLELARTAHRAVLALAGLEVPVVAAVQGAAAGAGLALTLVADVVLAGESATFLTAYAQAGLTPDCGTSWLLPQVVGLRRALALTLTDRRLTAGEAADWGLVTDVHPDEELAKSARQAAARIAAGPFPALGRTRRLLRNAPARSLADQLGIEAATIAEAAASAAAGARLDAFVNGKRK